MPRMRVLLLSVLWLAGCGAQPPADAPGPTAAPDNPVADVPPATAPVRPAAPADAAPAITFAGFGGARFGDDEAAVHRAWGAPIGGSQGEGACRYLIPSVRGEEVFRLGFMLDGGRFVRVDVHAADIEAPGGGRVGMQADEIRRRYAGVQEQPHRYVEGGRYLRIADPAGGAGVLLFEADASGRITEWRAGLPPHVDYVEGCS
ncbi:MAG TPA: lectin [Lysobacter sp.]|nr:lectin [Lysobacter sp.]